MKRYVYATISELAEAMESGETTSLDCVFAAFERISALDSDGPRLNAVLEINPQAERLAMAMDAERKAGRVRGPLHGVPVFLKDNIDTADMTHTSAGSLALANRFAPCDAFVVECLSSAGAIIMGKVNMTEFANYIAKDMPNGFSSRGGQVKNPWGDFEPGGSSAGSGVAVAAGYVPLAIGTETFGSIIYPAGLNGIAAIKPTVGLVSRRGILPISISQDTAGPMGRTLLDCAIALDVMARPDYGDPATLHGYKLPSLADAVRNARGDLRGVTLGLFNKDGEGKPIDAKAFHDALDLLRELGATIVEAQMPAYRHECCSEVLSNEFRVCMDAALKGSIGSPTTLAEIAAFNLADPQNRIPYGQANFDRAMLPSKGLGNPAYLNARKWMREFAAQIGNAFASQSLDAVITPVCSWFAVPGFPSVTLPVGLESGCPVPLVLNGLAFSEAKLVSISATLERVLEKTYFVPEGEAEACTAK